MVMISVSATVTSSASVAVTVAGLCCFLAVTDTIADAVTVV